MWNRQEADMHEIKVNIEDCKAARYESLLPQINSLIEGESDLIANLGNVAAALGEAFGFFWTGFYLVRSSAASEKGQELVLGPFQGTVACTRIGYGKGVCGSAWKAGKSIVVEDVEKFPGHIACSSLSRSEIVVPLVMDDGEIIGVLDIDSSSIGTFDDVDRHYLEKLCRIICESAK